MTDLLATLNAGLAGRYDVGEELGRGGMATVFRARDLRHNREVALKVLHPDLAPAIGLDRFEREITIAARLNHPHILPLLDSGSVPHQREPGVRLPFYVMPLVDGESLRARLMREGRMPVDEALRLTRQVADALDYAHRQGVVHRDIKPENILLAEGHAVVADFGLARAVGASGGDRLTRTGLTVGTPGYMSPEQVMGLDDIDSRSDVYSLAAVLYEMVSGDRPFEAEGDGFRTSVGKQMTQPVPSLRKAGHRVPSGVDSAIQRALSVDRAGRPGSAGDFITMLALDRNPAGAGGRSGRVIGIGAAAVLALAALGYGLFGRGGDAITTLAILPLSTGTDSSALYLSAGIHEAVADRLRQLPSLRVTAPSLVAQLQRQRPTATSTELGAELSVGAVLTWSLRPSPDSLHIRAELLKVPGGSLLWSAGYDRPRSDLLLLETDLARTITESLRLTLSGAEQATLARLPTSDPVAYDLFLRGRYFLGQASAYGSSVARGNADSLLAYANRIIERDPAFAGGHYLRAEYFLVAAARGWRRPFGVTNDSGVAALARAFELDSTLADTWRNRGSNELYLTDDFAAARRDLSTAVRLDPDLAYSRLYYGIYLGEFEGQLDSAVSHLRHAVALSPHPIYYNTLGDLLMRAGRYDSAIVVLREAVRQDPTLPGPSTRLIRSFEQTGRWREAISARRVAPDTTGAGAFARAFEAEGETGYRRVLAQDIRRRIDSLERAMAGPRTEAADTFPPLPEARIALLYGQLGEWTRAMDWVLQDRTRRPRRFRWFVANPEMRGLANDPRYLPLVRQEGLESLLPPSP